MCSKYCSDKNHDKIREMVVGKPFEIDVIANLFDSFEEEVRL